MSLIIIIKPPLLLQNTISHRRHAISKTTSAWLCVMSSACVMLTGRHNHLLLVSYISLVA